MPQLNRYEITKSITSLFPNGWDILVLTIVMEILIAFAWGGSHLATPYQLGEPLVIDLAPTALPGYAMSMVNSL